VIREVYGWVKKCFVKENGAGRRAGFNRRCRPLSNHILDVSQERVKNWTLSTSYSDSVQFIEPGEELESAVIFVFRWITKANVTLIKGSHTELGSKRLEPEGWSFDAERSASIMGNIKENLSGKADNPVARTKCFGMKDGCLSKN
jgi:hypothetical protein